MALDQSEIDRAAEQGMYDGIIERHEKQQEELHAMLDAANVPKADHVECNDPGCDSKLVHRVKFLIMRDANLRDSTNILKSQLVESMTHVADLRSAVHAIAVMADNPVADLTQQIHDMAIKVYEATDF